MARLRQSFIRALQLNIAGRCAEIGVQHGYNALAMLQAGAGYLYLIDSYPDRFCGMVPTNEEKLAEMKKGMLERLKGFKFDFIEMDSVKGAEMVQYPLDYCYIDANHEKEYARQDAEVWLPKVRPGGILGGHDYNFRSVKEAVDEFAKAHNLTVCTSPHDSDWWIEL